MKAFLPAIGLALLLALGSLLIMTVFIEGFGAWVPIVISFIVFGGAGYFMKRENYKGAFYAAFIIPIAFLLTFFNSGIHLNTVFDLLFSPNKIDEDNFYILLPVFAFIATFLGYFYKRFKLKS